jgi:hypothetical protein
MVIFSMSIFMLPSDPSTAAHRTERSTDDGHISVRIHRCFVAGRV